MPLYTFIAAYEGGTYISQAVAPDEKAAILAWAENLEVQAIPGLGRHAKAKLLESLRKDQSNDCFPTPITGVENVWFDLQIVCGKAMFVNFVQTASA